MKHNTLFKFLVLALLVAGGGKFNVWGQDNGCSSNIIRTLVNGIEVPWDSVMVKNDTRHTTFWLYYPDTILNDCTTSIQTYETVKTFGFSDFYPNPCTGNGHIKFAVPYSESATITICDVQGRIYLRKSLEIEVGNYEFAVTIPVKGIYMLCAETERYHDVCKIVCTESAGGDFGVEVSAIMPQVPQKICRGGEGLFNSTDLMKLTAYITYNGQVMSSWPVGVNYTEYLEDYLFSDSLYEHGAIQFSFLTNENEEFSIANRTFRTIALYNSCFPFEEIPYGYHITFYDSTLYAEPDVHPECSSACWNLSGWYKYSITPTQESYSCPIYELIVRIYSMDTIISEGPCIRTRYIDINRPHTMTMYDATPFVDINEILFVEE